jgi:hypothetical protein
MADSPTSRTLKYLRDQGWPLVQVVERWNQYARRRIELFGFIDVVAYHPERGWLLVQTTSGSHVQERIKKITVKHRKEARLLAVNKCNRIMVHGWRKLKGRWAVREIDITEQILEKKAKVERSEDG